MRVSRCRGGEEEEGGEMCMSTVSRCSGRSCSWYVRLPRIDLSLLLCIGKVTTIAWCYRKD